ncbi:amidohydrolase [Pseudonocardia sp.]|uniref:amidohydrolase n=1 Tax=Pseudonocardia sp. TaxID=60912 RepID=UPI002D8BC0A5|nr:amidohydrolase [Pseudonocardia sp.]
MRAEGIYLNGRVWPGVRDGTGGDPTAIAVSGGRVVALDTDAVVRDLAGPGTAIVDLGGRRVVPGLIDGHIHAVRAGASFDRELHWTGMPNVQSALKSIQGATATCEPGEWIRAVGGWHPTQFTEGRSPTREELDGVAPDHPVYLQVLYEYSVLNTAAVQRSGLDRMRQDPPGGVIERDADGRPTGRVSGLGAFSQCLAAMPRRTRDQERASTAAMMRELHAAGLTGLVDAGGFGMSPERYDSLFDLWRRDELSMRMRLYFSAVDPGHEPEQLEAWLRHQQSRFGDDLLRVLGVGEVVHFGCHDFEGLEPFEICEEARADFLRITRATARRGWPMQVHAVLDSSLDVILDVWEEVHAETPLTDLRFVIAHADRISPRNAARLAALGAGVVVDDHLVFKAGASERVWGQEAIHRAPPLGELRRAGIPIAAGTDATRASSFSPWLALWWMVTGRSLDGVRRRAPEHLLTREEALAAYTAGSAWMSFEEHERGNLFPGALADFAVLDADYLTVDESAIPAIAADLTVVGGQPVFSTGAVADATRSAVSIPEPERAKELSR